MAGRGRPRKVESLDREPPKVDWAAKANEVFGVSSAPARLAPASLRLRVSAVAPDPEPRYVIEDDVPMPARSQVTAAIDALPLEKLKVGQSFFAPDIPHERGRYLTTAAQNRWKDRVFRVRKEGDGVRFWRVA